MSKKNTKQNTPKPAVAPAVTEVEPTEGPKVTESAFAIVDNTDVAKPELAKVGKPSEPIKLTGGLKQVNYL